MLLGLLCLVDEGESYHWPHHRRRFDESGVEESKEVVDEGNEPEVLEEQDFDNE
uniref:Uncharacterized protein n=1 Tax=Ciona intestinalis TaxID=7719 RepID=H2XNP7_CIOIN